MVTRAKQWREKGQHEHPGLHLISKMERTKILDWGKSLWKVILQLGISWHSHKKFKINDHYVTVKYHIHINVVQAKIQIWKGLSSTNQKGVSIGSSPLKNPRMGKTNVKDLWEIYKKTFSTHKIGEQ